MEPIVPLERKSKSPRIKAAANTHRAALFDRLTCILAIITTAVTFGAAAYFLFGFAQTDLGVLTLLSSAALCFGIGSLAYGPTAFIAWAARQAMRGRAIRLHYGLSLLLSAPWIVLSIVFLTQSAIPKPFGIIALTIALWISLWAAYKLIALQKAKAPPNDAA